MSAGPEDETRGDNERGPWTHEEKWISHVIGRELTRARKGRGLSRSQLVELMGNAVAGVTYGTYERGDRRCHLTSFVLICRALGEDPGELLTRALKDDRGDGGEIVTINVARLACAEDPLPPLLRKWAKEKCDSSYGSNIIRVRRAMVQNMAKALGISVEKMSIILEPFMVK